MLTWKEYKNNYLKSHSDFVACSVENWQFLERAYDDYVEQQEITILKKENEKLKRDLMFAEEFIKRQGFIMGSSLLKIKSHI